MDAYANEFHFSQTKSEHFQAISCYRAALYSRGTCQLLLNHRERIRLRHRRHSIRTLSTGNKSPILSFLLGQSSATVILDLSWLFLGNPFPYLARLRLFARSMYQETYSVKRLKGKYLSNIEANDDTILFRINSLN